LDNPNGEPAGIIGGAMYTFSRNSIRNVTDGTTSTIAAGEKYIPSEDEVRQAQPNLDEAMMHYHQGDTAYFSGDNRFAILRSTACGMANGEVPATGSCGPGRLKEVFGSEHSGISNFVFLDGHVQAIQQSVDLVTLQRISTIADDQTVDTTNL
jgi:prepilin-type processing-associated H-X9-DG protein